MFILKAFFILLNFCPEFFGHLGIRLNKKFKVIFKIYDVADWEINNNNTHIAQNFKK